MKFKKSISFVLTLCMVLSLFATFVIPVAADEGIELLVSHHNLYNWGTFEGMVITGDGQTVADVIPTYGANIKWWNMYVIENVDGEYVATEHYKNVDECHTTPVPAGGFLYYVYSDNSDWAKVDDGVLLGYTFELVDFTLEESFAIDTNADPSAAKHMIATAPAAAPELPEGATGLDYFGYTHTYINHVMYVDADMTLGELVTKYYGQSKDLNYFKVIVVNEDGTVAATYLTLGRPDGVKTDIAVTAGQVVLALSADSSNAGRHEIADTVNVGDVVTLYNVDFDAEPGELANAGFTVEAAAPEAPEAGVVVPEGVVLQSAPYGDVSVLTDGETAEGLFECFWGNQAYLVAIENKNTVSTPWDVVIVLKEETTFNTVTIYYWDEANSFIHMPETVAVTVNGETYEAIALTTDSKLADEAAGISGAGFVHAVEYALGEEVTANSFTVTSTAGAGVFNMMTEVAVSYVEATKAPFEDGDNVVITYPADNLAISAEEDVYNDKYRLAGTDVANGAVFTVEITDDGIYFICNGKYLTSGATGNNLTLEDEASEYSLWVLEEAENGWYIKNVNAAYNGNAQYIEYYFAFTTYGFNASKADIYTFQFVVQEAPALNEVDGGALPEHNSRDGSLSIAANTAITYTVAFEHGANFNLWSEDVTVLVNGEALEMGMLGYVATPAKGDTVTIVNAGAEAVEIYPSISAIIPGTMSSPIVLDELGDITANVTEDIVKAGGTVFYLYTAPANGTLTITMPEGNWTYAVNNLTAGVYGDTQWSDSEDSSATTSIDVSAGDEIQIIVGTYNPESMWDIPVGELTFNAAFEANVVVSQVVENFNHADWNTGINTYHAAYIFTDAEIYAGVGMTWWYHASFAPTANGGYVVVEVAAPGSDAATKNTLAIPEGGFVWVAWTSSEEGYGASSGAYAKAIMSGLKAGDIVLFNGLDIANCTTTADASATVLAPAADMDLIVSHNYNYNWHCYETQIITNTIADSEGNYLVKAGDAPFMAGNAADADILYIVENVGGAYLVTGIVGGKALVDVVIPDGGFLYYVTSNCTGYDAICHGELIGKYLILGDIDLNTSFAIDPEANPAYTMKAVSGFGKGDVNLNGVIDATDYAILRKLALNTLTAEDLGDVAYSVADVNGDGKVNARDYYLVKRAFLAEDNSILGWEVKEDEAE